MLLAQHLNEVGKEDEDLERKSIGNTFYIDGIALLATGKFGIVNSPSCTLLP